MPRALRWTQVVAWYLVRIVSPCHLFYYRGSSLEIKHHPLGPYRRPPRTLPWAAILILFTATQVVSWYLVRPALLFLLPQGYLAHKKPPCRRTLQYAYACGPMVFIGVLVFSYKRGTSVPPFSLIFDGQTRGAPFSALTCGLILGIVSKWSSGTW
jgi:hypothetical protein